MHATVDGFVERVDQRLTAVGLRRPVGDSSVVACEDYYEVHGREWERFALLKARPVAGDLGTGSYAVTDAQAFYVSKIPRFWCL